MSLDAELAALPPTLGPQVVAWQTENLVHGPGDVRGRQYGPTLEHQAFIYAAYEVFPQGHRQAGRRQHPDAFYSRAKGTAKTEMAAGIGAGELADDAPVRCDGFDAAGQPVGRAVPDPDIPFLATTLEQAQDLAFERLKVMLEEGPLADACSCGAEDVYWTRGRYGKAYVVTSKARSKDGYIPTWTHADETHLFTTEELRELVRTVWFNLDKRFDADPWGLQTTTAFAPGQQSVAELTFELQRQIERGEVEHPLLFDHLEASSHWDLEDDDQLRAAIIEASGLAKDFRNVEAIVRRFRDPRTDFAKACRYWLNQILKASNAWLSPTDIANAVLAGAKLRRPQRRDPICLGFDGSLFDDSTALVGITAEGLIFVVHVWEKPEGPDGRGWRVPTEEVDRVFRQTMRDFQVVRAYCDPPHWRDYVDAWHRDYGDVVVRFETRAEERMAAAVERLENRFTGGTAAILRSGPFGEALIRHLENTRNRLIGSVVRQAQERPPKVLQKEHPKSDLKIDLTVASVLANEAGADAHALGLFKPRRRHTLTFY